MLCACGLNFVHQCHELLVENPVWWLVYYGGWLTEEGLREKAAEEFTSNPYICFTPPRFGIRAIAMPFSRVQNYNRSAFDGNSLSPLKFYLAFPSSYIQQLVFPISKGTPFFPHEVVVGRMVCMGVWFAGVCRLFPCTGYINSELALDLSDWAIVYFVHALYYIIWYQKVQIEIKSHIDQNVYNAIISAIQREKRRKDSVDKWVIK